MNTPRHTCLGFALMLLLMGALSASAQPGMLRGANDTTLSSFRMDSTSMTADSVRRAQTAAHSTPATEKIPVVKRKIEYREQIALGLGMMFFIAFAMMTTQSWNPR